jgi:hypothetical protein
MRRRTYHVGDANAGFPTAQDVLNDAAKLVCLHLNEGPVGAPDYPSGIPDMHTIHDPMISVS